MKSRRVLGERRRVVDWPIAREDTAAEEAVGRAVGRELVVAVEVTVADPLIEAVDDGAGVGERDDSLHFDAWPKPQLNVRNQPEQPVSANCQPEEVRMLPA